MKKTPRCRQRRKNKEKNHGQAVETQPAPWMRELARTAAEARVDGGAGLQNLLQYAKFDERPQLSLTKRELSAA